MNDGRQNGALQRLRDFAATTELMTTKQAAQAIGQPEKQARNSLRKAVRGGWLFPCASDGSGRKQYATSKARADRVEAEACSGGRVVSHHFMRKLGACLGPVKDMPSLMLRVVVDEDDDCWIWQGAISRGRGGDVPVMQFDRKVMSVVRWVWRLTHPNVVLTSKQMVWRSRCSHARCVNPEHLKAGTRKEFGAWVKATGRWKGLPSKVSSAQLMGLSRRVITQAELDSIRLGHATIKQVAIKLDVWPSSVWRALRTPSFSTNSSAFTWRPSERKSA